MSRVAALSLLAACAHPTAAVPRKPTAPAVFDAAAIDAWVKHELDDRGAVGAALVVVRDGETVLARGYGTRVVGTEQPIDADTPFMIGSVSKQFACAVVLSLADEHKLSFDDPVAKYYPKLTNAASITLDDLGAHLSGYRDYYPLDYVDAPRMTTPIAPDDLLAQYAGMPLDFTPRSRSSYSNTGYVLLARIAERVAGAPYAKLLAERLFAPAGMTSATTVRPATAATGHGAFLLDPPRPETPEAAGWLLGAGDIFASANDLARWNLAFAGGKVLSEASRRRMTTPHAIADGRTTSYGCGLSTRIVEGETVHAHTGWVGGFVAHSATIARTRSTVVLLSNDQHVDLGDLHDAIVRLVANDQRPVPTVAGPPAADALRALLVQLQRGALDRATLGPDLDVYFDAARVAAAAAGLRKLGEPQVTLKRRRERGGLEVTSFSVELGKRTVSATMFRSPDGKIRQLLLEP